jgi:cbb3-type cytochrome c oxidase subunit III
MDIGIRALLLLASAAVSGASPAVAQAPAAATPAAIAQGDSIFHSKGNCYACHGANAQGAVGPNLTDSEWIHSDGSYDAIVKQITTGVTAEESKSKIPMPPKGGSQITDDEVKAVAAYVYSLSHKKPS